MYYSNNNVIEKVFKYKILMFILHTIAIAEFINNTKNECVTVTDISVNFCVTVKFHPFP